MSGDERMAGIPPERLIELAVDPSASPTELERSLLEGAPDLRRELDDLNAFLAHQRKLVAEAEPEESSSLAERVLGFTTRRDVGWRGDLRLVRELFLTRCRESMWVRFAAASLLVHLLALPVVAWFVLRVPPEEPRISFDLPVPDEYFVEPRVLPEVEAPDPMSLLEEGPIGRYARYVVENARRRARFVLHEQGAPRVQGPEPRTEVARALAARSSGVNRGDWSELSALVPKAGSPLVRALLAEAALDRAILTGDGGGLREVLEELPTEPGAAERPVLDMTRAAAARALELGYADEALRARWQTDLWYAPRQDVGGRPFEGDWFTQLEQALSRDSADPYAAAWVGESARR